MKVTLPGLLALFLCYWLGQWCQQYFALPVPAPLLGLLLMMLVLLVIRRVPSSVALASQMLLKHMSVFFVPATLSIVLYRDQLAEHGIIILLSLVVTTMLSLALTAMFSQWLQNRKTPGGNHPHE